jgi:hypothetical protein
MGLPYASRPWPGAERRILNLYARRLFAGRYRETREAAEACTKALGEAARVSAYPEARLRRPRSVQSVYAALAHVVARAGLPRFNSPWKRTELEVLGGSAGHFPDF